MINFVSVSQNFTIRVTTYLRKVRGREREYKKIMSCVVDTIFAWHSVRAGHTFRSDTFCVIGSNHQQSGSYFHYNCGFFSVEEIGRLRDFPSYNGNGLFLKSKKVSALNFDKIYSPLKIRILALDLG